MAQHWGRRGAHLSENKGLRSECKKFEVNLRQNLWLASVSTICDEDCSSAHALFSQNFCCVVHSVLMNMDFNQEVVFALKSFKRNCHLKILIGPSLGVLYMQLIAFEQALCLRNG